VKCGRSNKPFSQQLLNRAVSLVAFAEGTPEPPCLTVLSEIRRYEWGLSFRLIRSLFARGGEKKAGKLGPHRPVPKRTYEPPFPPQLKSPEPPWREARAPRHAESIRNRHNIESIMPCFLFWPARKAVTLPDGSTNVKYAARR